MKSAVKLVKLARSWNELIRDPRVNFAEGELLYRSGERTAGIALMKDALETADPEVTLVDERLYLAEALSQHGTRTDELLTLELLADVIPCKDHLPERLLDQFWVLAMQLDRDFRNLRRVFNESKCPSNCYFLSRAVQEQVGTDPLFPFTVGESIIPLFKRALQADVAVEDRSHLQRLKELKEAFEKKFRSAR